MSGGLARVCSGRCQENVLAKKRMNRESEDRTKGPTVVLLPMRGVACSICSGNVHPCLPWCSCANMAEVELKLKEAGWFGGGTVGRLAFSLGDVIRMRHVRGGFRCATHQGLGWWMAWVGAVVCSPPPPGGSKRLCAHTCVGAAMGMSARYVLGGGALAGHSLAEALESSQPSAPGRDPTNPVIPIPPHPPAHPCSAG